jgi:hypothetical protein
MVDFILIYFCVFSHVLRPIPNGLYLANRYPTPEGLVLFDDIKQLGKKFMCIGESEMGIQGLYYIWRIFYDKKNGTNCFYKNDLKI